jgi:uncharacterized protein (TIGR03000 family)
MRRLLFASLLAAAAVAVDANRASAWWNNPQPAVVAFPMVYPAGWYVNTYPFAWYYPWYANYNYSHGSYSHWWQSHGWAFYAGQPIPSNFRIHPIYGAYFFYIVPQHGHPFAVPGHHHHDAHNDHKHPLPAPKKKDVKKKEPGKVTIRVPGDAKILFNGVAASGTGDSRTFVTPDLDSDRDYEYLLTAEVVRNGRTLTATERVIVRAGSDTQVSLSPTSVAVK